MSDVDRLGTAQDEDRLPWLEAVDDEDHRAGSGAGTIVAALIAALVALGLVVGGAFWLRDRGRDTGGGEGELIAAPAGPYKEKPATPGGMKVEGQGDAAYAASTGAELNAAVDIAALPEAPVARPAATKPAEPTQTAEAKPAAAPAKPAAPVETAAAVAPEGTKLTGGVIQLGAFSSPAAANAAWKSLSGRFGYLKPLTSAVMPVSSGGKTLYRLRASAGGEAGTVCGKLKVAGETCAVVGG
jgi:hypothetical protein